jgi:DNA-binding response OmpR family regulator
VQPRKLLVIDHNADSGSLLVRSLTRKFPAASVDLCAEMGDAIGAVASQKIDAIVLHRTEEEDAVSIVRALRKLDGTVPIIVVSGIDRSEQVLAAGATGFMNYEEWLRIGTVVASALSAAEKDSSLA